MPKTAFYNLPPPRTIPQLLGFFKTILGPEKPFYVLTIVYGIGISLLSLATPISVQMLVNSIVNTGLRTHLIVLSLTLLGLLLLVGVLNALRIHLIDVFGRRFYARMVSEIALRCIYALNPFFEDSGKGPLFNRYFDIIIVIKRIPYLLVGGFSIFLQAIVGFVLVSLYHPAFMIFNLFFVFFVWLIWAIWGKSAMRSALVLSHQKHASAAWIEGLAKSNGFFKTQKHIREALRHTDEVTEQYIKAHVAHFRDYFSQTIGLLVVYAVASASLLGLGGWLVIQGQLSVGQLVAAELVFSIMFYGFFQLGTYLTYFYDLCAAIDELSLFYDIEQETFTGKDDHLPGDTRLEFIEAKAETRGVDVNFNFSIPSGSRVLAYATSHGIQRLFKNFMRRHATPNSGYITLGGNDVRAVEAHILRHEIIVLNRPNAIEMSIREYLHLSAEEVTSEHIMHAIRTVGLEKSLARFELGLDTPIAASGWPLSISEVMQLKLAATIIANPKLVILSNICDIMPRKPLEAALDYIQNNIGNTTIIRFSYHNEPGPYQQFLFMDAQEQILFDNYKAFRSHVDEYVERTDSLLALTQTDDSTIER